MYHKLRDLSRTVGMVTVLKHNSLMSVSKFADKNYIMVLTLEEVFIYDGNEVKLWASVNSIITGWRWKTSRLCRVPLKPKIVNKNIDTMILNWPDSVQSVNDVYNLPSTGKSIRYIHACSVFPTKSTWIKATGLGNYTTWPGLTIKPTRKYFLET